MRSNQKYGGPPYRHRVYYSMGIAFALVVVMAFRTGQPAWVLPGVVGPAVLLASKPRGKAARLVPAPRLSRTALAPAESEF
jgi:hypothetical protein